MWHTLSTNEVEQKIGTNIKFGLTDRQVKERQEKYGLNKLDEQKKKSIIIKFLEQFKDFMIIILLIASVVSAIVEKIGGTGDYFDSIIIIAIVVFNAIMGLVQEAKAEKSLEALKKMSAPTCKVRRNGQITTINGNEIVSGDVVLLEAGNYVPADCRLISSSNLKIEESSLTGETIPSEKNADIVLPEKTALGDMTNLAFATTIVVNGHGEGLVTEIGMNTKVGKIAKMIITDETPETPIQKKLGQVGKSLGIACLFICVFIFIIGIFKKIEPIEMFMTSVGLAVAAIPEGLPAIVTIMLSIGVTKIARKNSIIRKLPAVETLGSSSVICSDKTGTLTQNKMQVTKIMNSNGEVRDSKLIEKILELAVMCTDVEIINNELTKKNYQRVKNDISQKSKNAIYNEGMYNLSGEPTEVALVERAKKEGIDKRELYQEMKRVSDLPFNSNRKMMTTIHKLNSGYRIITKGAPDVLLKHCNKVYENGKIVNLDYTTLANIEKQNNLMADKALRVLAISYLDIPELPNEITTEKIEKNLIFVGLVRNDRPSKRRSKRSYINMQKSGNKNCNDYRGLYCNS